jgi:hypothetical protein
VVRRSVEGSCRFAHASAKDVKRLVEGSIVFGLWRWRAVRMPHYRTTCGSIRPPRWSPWSGRPATASSA